MDIMNEFIWRKLYSQNLQYRACRECWVVSVTPRQSKFYEVHWNHCIFLWNRIKSHESLKSTSCWFANHWTALTFYVHAILARCIQLIREESHGLVDWPYKLTTVEFKVTRIIFLWRSTSLSDSRRQIKRSHQWITRDSESNRIWNKHKYFGCKTSDDFATGSCNWWICVRQNVLEILKTFRGISFNVSIIWIMWCCQRCQREEWINHHFWMELMQKCVKIALWVQHIWCLIQSVFVRTWKNEF